MNTILAIDTTLGACSAAIIKDGELLGHMLEARARGHVERLLPMVAELCEETGTALPELSHIAVTVGPGTFAGVRIGLSAAKGMGLALDVPLIPVTTLQAIAYEYGFDHKDFSGKIAVAIDARRGEIYLQVFEINLGACEGYSDAAAVPVDTAKNNIHSTVSVVIGSAAPMLKDENLHYTEGYIHPKAEMIAGLAAASLSLAMDSDQISPLYLRAPDAILPAKQDMIIIDD